MRQIAAQGHSDLLVLERIINEKTGKLFTVIRVEDVRRTVPFFGSTAGEGGWRVCIVDCADELQYPQAANALLKILEEPPANALLLLVSHALALHALGDALGGYEPARLASFIDAVNEWLSVRLANAPNDKARMLRLAEAWDKINQAARDADEYNLERKPLVFSVFNLLAEAAR
jgi:hypothetical protein